MKSILFITSNSLATNPRLVKEIDLARHRYKCTVVSFQLNSWSDKIDDEIALKYPEVSFLFVSGGKQQYVQWLISSMLEKITRKVYYCFENNLLISAIAHSKRTIILLKKLKHLKRHDMVIAHNLAALYPAYTFTTRHNIKLAFDVEDFHPGEVVAEDNYNEIKRRKFILTSILPHCSYLSFSSPLICKKIIDLVPGIEQCKKEIINNSFLSSEFLAPVNAKSDFKIKLVWFSQKISTGRGLELIIPALHKCKDKIELTLIGSLDLTFYQKYIKPNSEFIQAVKPLSQIKLHKLLSDYDVGLALELESADINRDICLTNKIFAYTQAGLFVLATSTQAQSKFVCDFPWVGQLVGQSPIELDQAIESIIKLKQEIRSSSNQRYINALNLSWEKESTKLLKIWDQHLH
ncbi:hypothetical protein [Pontibacter populi]|uniref:Glycosyl transferase family 1 domain-containing protein n=1 Tax=Pontibacter populi TaxID=890055 RepID=A0ABV1RV77_9BACT